MGVRQVPDSEREPVEPESRVRSTLSKHFDTLIAIGLSAAIFSSAYFFRIAPQLKNLDGQMVAVSTQLNAVNEGLSRMNNHELFHLRLTSRDLQQRMQEVITQSTVVYGDLAAATTEVMAVRAQLVALERALAEYQAMVSAAVQPFAEPLPDLHGAAREVAEKLEAAASQVGPDGKVFPPLYERASVIAARLEAAEKELPKRKFPTLQQDAEALAKRIEEAGARLGTKRRPFPKVSAAAHELHAEIQRLRKDIKGGIVACKELKPVLLRQLKQAGHCK